MDNKEKSKNIKDKSKKKEKKNKEKKVTSKKSKKIKIKSDELVTLKDKPETEKNIEIKENNENKGKIIIIQGSETNIKKPKSYPSIKKEAIIDSSPNNELSLKIKEKMKKIKELSLSQEISKKSLTELLKKVSLAIETNEEILYLDDSTNSEDKEMKIKKLEELLEKRKSENAKMKEINRKFKNKYENIMKEINTPSVEKLDFLQKRISALKENNSILSKEISMISQRNNLAKISSLNPKYKKSDIKLYSDEYVSLTKERYKQNIMLKNNKKLIKDLIQQFDNLIRIINEKKEEVISSDLEKEISNLRQDLSGDEEKIYNRIISNQTIILEEYYKNKNMKKNNTTNSLRLLFASRTKKIRLKNKAVIKSRSTYNVIDNPQKENNKIDHTINIKKDLSINDYDLDNIDYNSMSNYDFENISSKKQKYLNLTEKLDKTINDTSLFYENRAKDIGILLDMNSKKLSNIQQENELLKSEIADMKRILELNQQQNKLKNINNRYILNKKNEEPLRHFKLHKNSNNFDLDIYDKNIERKNYIDAIKKKYKIQEKNKINIFQKESLSNNRSYY